MHGTSNINTYVSEVQAVALSSDRLRKPTGTPEARSPEVICYQQNTLAVLDEEQELGTKIGSAAVVRLELLLLLLVTKMATRRVRMKPPDSTSNTQNQPSTTDSTSSDLSSNTHPYMTTCSVYVVGGRKSVNLQLFHPHAAETLLKLAFFAPSYRISTRKVTTTSEGFEPAPTEVECDLNASPWTARPDGLFR
uniref:Uncharacterized protein n=1 Tax=Setaria digitata TaxID=48799 RepID=A0A915Q0N4_9BILA